MLLHKKHVRSKLSLFVLFKVCVLENDKTFEMKTILHSDAVSDHSSIERICAIISSAVVELVPAGGDCVANALSAFALFLIGNNSRDQPGLIYLSNVSWCRPRRHDIPCPGIEVVACGPAQTNGRTGVPSTSHFTQHLIAIHLVSIGCSIVSPSSSLSSSSLSTTNIAEVLQIAACFSAATTEPPVTTFVSFKALFESPEPFAPLPEPPTAPFAFVFASLRFSAAFASLFCFLFSTSWSRITLMPVTWNYGARPQTKICVLSESFLEFAGSFLASHLDAQVALGSSMISLWMDPDAWYFSHDTCHMIPLLPPWWNFLDFVSWFF